MDVLLVHPSHIPPAVSRVDFLGVLNRSGDFRTHNLELRGNLDMYANIVRCKSIKGIGTRHDGNCSTFVSILYLTTDDSKFTFLGIDLIAIRENTEGEYSGLEHESVPGVVECLKVITEEKSLRIAKFAFDYALEHNRKKVTCIHKANIMKLSDGLFKRCCEEVCQKLNVTGQRKL